MSLLDGVQGDRRGAKLEVHEGRVRGFHEQVLNLDLGTLRVFNFSVEERDEGLELAEGFDLLRVVGLRVGEDGLVVLDLSRARLLLNLVAQELDGAGMATRLLSLSTKIALNGT